MAKLRPRCGLSSQPLLRSKTEAPSTISDGSLAAIDDGNVGRSQYFGLFDMASPLADAFAFAWAEAPTPYETDGNIDLAADALIHYDDARVSPAQRRRRRVGRGDGDATTGPARRAAGESHSIVIGVAFRLR